MPLHNRDRSRSNSLSQFKAKTSTPNFSPVEEQASRALHELKSHGVRIALDDFGTGYSSLSYVKRFPVDSIKIDRSFVHELVGDPDARTMVTAIVAMAHELDLTVVAEGVETEAQEQFLRGLRCDELQGFRFARPEPPDALERILFDPDPS